MALKLPGNRPATRECSVAPIPIRRPGNNSRHENPAAPTAWRGSDRSRCDTTTGSAARTGPSPPAATAGWPAATITSWSARRVCQSSCLRFGSRRRFLPWSWPRNQFVRDRRTRVRRYRRIFPFVQLSFARPRRAARWLGPESMADGMLVLRPPTGKQADCRLPIANCRLEERRTPLPLPSIGNWQSAICNWQCIRRMYTFAERF